MPCGVPGSRGRSSRKEKATLSSSIEVNTADLDPNLVQLGILVGLLTPNGDPNTLAVNIDWFSNPLESIESIPSANGAQVINLLETMLGGVAGNAIGTPDNSISGNWYPIRNPIPDGRFPASGVSDDVRCL